VILFDITQQAIFQVRVAEFAGVVVAEDSLHMRGRQDLTDDIEYGIIVEGVADLLQFLVELSEDLAFDGIRRNEVENQAIFELPVPMNPAHALFEPVRIPRDIVVEQNVTALEVDALARGFRSNQDLNCTIPELLLGMEARAFFLTAARFHAAMDATDVESPIPEALK
jgi:hypothetical protein